MRLPPLSYATARRCLTLGPRPPPHPALHLKEPVQALPRATQGAPPVETHGNPRLLLYLLVSPEMLGETPGAREGSWGRQRPWELGGG